MNESRNTLDGFWNSFDNIQTRQKIPAWQHGFVPREHSETYPRISYEVVTSPNLNNYLLRARVWDRRATIGFMGLTDDVMRQAGERIPESGVVLKTGIGTITLYRGTPFTWYMPADPDDPNVVQGVINYEIRFRNQINL